MNTQQRTPPQNEARDTEDDDDFYPSRLPNSAIRYRTTSEQGIIPRPRYDVTIHQGYQLRTPVPPRRSRMQVQPQTEQRQVAPKGEQNPPRHFRPHWLVFVGIGMVAMILLVIGAFIVMAWVNHVRDDMAYGNPRTYQCDAVVGHDDSPEHPSHFIAVNLNGRIEVIEFPGGDATRARVYLVSQLLGDNPQETPVTLTFRDVTGVGKPAMLVRFGLQTVVFVNERGAFQPAMPGDHISL